MSKSKSNFPIIMLGEIVANMKAHPNKPLPKKHQEFLSGLHATVVKQGSLFGAKKDNAGKIRVTNRRNLEEGFKKIIGKIGGFHFGSSDFFRNIIANFPESICEGLSNEDFLRKIIGNVQNKERFMQMLLGMGWSRYNLPSVGAKGVTMQFWFPSGTTQAKMLSWVATYGLNATRADQVATAIATFGHTFTKVKEPEHRAEASASRPVKTRKVIQGTLVNTSDEQDSEVAKTGTEA